MANPHGHYKALQNTRISHLKGLSYDTNGGALILPFISEAS
jgi:hypothetical protein